MLPNGEGAELARVGGRLALASGGILFSLDRCAIEDVVLLISVHGLLPEFRSSMLENLMNGKTRTQGSDEAIRPFGLVRIIN